MCIEEGENIFTPCKFVGKMVICVQSAVDLVFSSFLCTSLFSLFYFIFATCTNLVFQFVNENNTSRKHFIITFFSPFTDREREREKAKNWCQEWECQPNEKVHFFLAFLSFEISQLFWEIEFKRRRSITPAPCAGYNVLL